MHDEFESAEAGAVPDDVSTERGRLAARAGDAIERGRDYLGRFDAAELRADVEDTIRTRPILSVCVAAAVGFIVGRVIRD